MPDASFDVAQGWVRLQLLNACNARGLLVQFIDASSPSAGPIPFQLLGTDGGLLARPRALERVFLHTAERIDVAIDLTGRREVAALSAPFDARHQMAGRMPARRHDGAAHAYAPLAAGVVCGSAGTGGLADGAAMRLFMLRAAQAGRAGSVPAELSSLPDVAPVAVPPRRLRLDFDDEAGFVIDNTPYRADEPGIIVPRGAAEVWELRNSPISMPHPMHLHGFAWRVLRRQGTFGPARALAVESGGRLPTDLGVKDTVVLWPNETLWLQADFALPDDAAFRGPQRYMLHCHNLEHEDGGMMRNVTVGP
jgi:FtsP/CotA-like multicopper oxidase with cupredoxin domain